MAVKKRKPTSPGRRFQTVSDFATITKSKPEKSLLAKKKRSSGRNTRGRITSRHRGGGHKRRYRIVDFRRNKDGVPARVAAVEYDPQPECPAGAAPTTWTARSATSSTRWACRSATSWSRVPPPRSAPANALPLRMIPAGTVVHAIEMRPGGGAKLARAAGTGVQLMSKEGNRALLRLPSGEVRYVPLDCRATIGQVGNPEAELVKLGKAGRNRWKGVRPQTRGVAMNPVDPSSRGRRGSFLREVAIRSRRGASPKAGPGSVTRPATATSFGDAPRRVGGRQWHAAARRGPSWTSTS